MSMVAILATAFAGTLLAAEVTDVIDHSATSSYLGNAAYSSWVDVFRITGTSGAKYSIRSMGTKGSSNAIQWNANGYLYMTTAPSGYKLKSVTITTTSNKNIDIFAQNSAYTGYPSGTALSTLAATTSGSTYTFGSNYKFLALKGTASSTSISSISIVWEEETADPGTVTTIDHSGITNTDVYVGTSAGVLSATVMDNSNNVISGASVVWSGNNNEVATIDASSGAVTLVSAGTVTFTATYAGVSGQYAGSAATYQMTVTDSTPYVQPTEFDINLNNSLFGTNYNGSAAGITDDSPISGVKNNVSVVYAGSGNHYVNNNQIRFYPNNKLSFEAPSGYDIKSIVFTSDGTWGATISADSGEYNSSTKTWTGAAPSVLFTGSGSSRCDMSKVTIIIGRPSPTITVIPSVTDINADEGEGTLDIEYENFSVNDMNDFSIQFFDAVGGNSISAPDWIDVLVAEQDPSVGEGYVVSYSVIENENDARSAYFMVYALDDDDVEVYSNFVTINQAAPVRDYATLPFEFDGGKEDITTTNGLTMYGLGSDYKESPKLKFDDPDDRVILRINQAPGVLTYHIKGNGFNGGTFKVQVSADGVAYTDLKTYTAIGDIQEEFDNLDESVRYIKWVYTQKSSGNVALGNITLAKKQAAAPDTYPLSLTAGDGGYWGTFYNGVAWYELPEGAQAFTMNASKQLYRLGRNGRIIPAGIAVVIIADVQAITLTKGEPADAVTVNGGDNILLGDDFPVEGDGTQYVLGKKNVIGFYKFLGSDIPANKAYYVVSE